MNLIDDNVIHVELRKRRRFIFTFSTSIQSKAFCVPYRDGLTKKSLRAMVYDRAEVILRDYVEGTEPYRTARMARDYLRPLLGDTPGDWKSNH